MDATKLKKVLTPGQIFVATRVIGAGKTIAQVARELAPTRDHENPAAMKRHEATVTKRLQRARQRIAGVAVMTLPDARRHLQAGPPPAIGTFSDAGLYAH